MEHYPFLLCYQQYFLLNNSIYRYRKKEMYMLSILQKLKQQIMLSLGGKWVSKITRLIGIITPGADLSA